MKKGINAMDVARGAGFAANSAVKLAKGRSPETKRVIKDFAYVCMSVIMSVTIGSHFATMYTRGMSVTNPRYHAVWEISFGSGLMLSALGFVVLYIAWKRTKEVEELKRANASLLAWQQAMASRATGVHPPSQSISTGEIDFQINPLKDTEVAGSPRNEEDAARVSEILATERWASEQRKSG